MMSTGIGRTIYSGGLLLARSGIVACMPSIAGASDVALSGDMKSIDTVAVAPTQRDASEEANVESQERVFLAPTVGRVTVGRADDIPRPKVFAYRAHAAGSLSVVSFSSRPASILDLTGNSEGARPLASYTLTSAFAERREQAGGGTRAHAGVDLAAPAGTPVAAAYAGRVATANWSGSYGLLVVVQHPDGLQTRYAHLSRLMVAQGQQVRQGEVIGLVGSTGRSTGPHLHYEVRQDGRPLDPLAR